MNKLKIVLIGSGNVATHLAGVFLKNRHEIVQIFSRNIEHAKQLALKTKSEALNQLSQITHQADLYIISVSDKAIPQIISKTDLKNKKVVHTAGSVSLDVFPEDFKNAGVFYPFQTFSKNREIDFSEIPLCIEANNPEFESFLIKLAETLSNNVWKINSEQRKYLHLSGVFACNFVNHLYAIAGDILEKKNIDRKILIPLVKETAAKIEELSPQQAQTGPAIRNDTESMKKHLDLLISTPEYKKIYEWFSMQIYSSAQKSSSE